MAGFCSDEVDNQGLLFGFCVKLDISADFGIVDSSYFMNIARLSTAEYQEARRCYCAWLWGRHGSRRLFIASVRRRVAAACWPRLYQPRPCFFKLVPKIKAIVGMGGIVGAVLSD